MSEVKVCIPKFKTNVILIEDPFNGILDPYCKSEFISDYIIQSLLSIVMPSTEIIHYYSERHIIIKVKVSDLLDAPMSNWKYNRPPDLIRCEDIAKFIYISKKPLDTMLYLSFNNCNRSFDIIDGIHRYTSLKILKQKNTQSLNLIDPGDYGNNGDAIWLYQSYVMLNIRFNAIESELIELFKNLNKSSPISELYIRDFVKEKREIIENVANNWQIKYKSHFSSTNKPNKPNTNRDRFIDLLQEVYMKYNIGEDNKYLLEQVLDRANWEISMNIPHKLTESIIEKCRTTGCWLFVYPNDKLIKKI